MYHDKIVPVNYTSAFERSKGYDIWDLHKGVANAVVALGRSSLQGVVGNGVVIGRLSFAPHISCPTHHPPNLTSCCFSCRACFGFPSPQLPPWYPPLLGRARPRAAHQDYRTPRKDRGGWWPEVNNVKKGVQRQREGGGETPKERGFFHSAPGFGVAAAGGACFFFSFPPSVLPFFATLAMLLFVEVGLVHLLPDRF